MQEKPIHHPLTVIFYHAGMISQGFLHACECTLNHIVRVGHTIDILICEQERQVSRYANHGRPEPLMGVNWTACDLVDSLFLQEACHFSFHFSNSPTNVSLSMPFRRYASSSNSFPASSCGFLVIFRLIIATMRNWHICILYSERTTNSFCRPSMAIPRMRYPHPTICLTASS